MSNKATKESCIEKIENKREFYRIHLLHPLNAEMFIYSLGGNKINKFVGNVPVVNISAGGIAFQSPLKLTLNFQVVYLFKIFINNQEHCIKGSLLWIKEVNEKEFLYGVEFSLNQHDKKELLSDIHILSVYNKRGGYNPDKYKHFQKK